MAWRLPTHGAVLLVLLLPLLPPGGALPGAPPVRVVAADETWENGVFVLSEPVLVLPGVTLTIRSATVFLDQPELCPTSGTAGYCQPSIMLDRGTLRVRDATLDSRTFTVLDAGSGWSVGGVGGVLDVEGSTLTHFKSIGTQAPGAVPSRLVDSTLVEARGPVSFTRGAVATVTGNVFEDMWMGVSVTDSASAISGNVFRHFARDYGAGPFGRPIDAQSTLAGQRLYDGTATITDNRIEDAATQGILSLSRWPNLVARNVVSGTPVGITVGLAVGDDVETIPALVLDNRVAGARQALTVYSSGSRSDATPLTLSAHGNRFDGTTCHDVAVLGLAPTIQLSVDARHNWWGSGAGPQAHGPGCDAFSGPATFLADPWLTEPPA